METDNKNDSYKTPFLDPDDYDPSESTVFGSSAGELIFQKNGKTEDSQWYPVLILIKNQKSSQRVVLSKKETFLGRDPKMDVSISHDLMISRSHVRILWQNIDHAGEYPRCFIEDLKSRNGTFLNKTPLKGRAQLSDGDHFLLGSSLFGFYIKDHHELEYDNNLVSMATLDGLTGLINRRAFLAEAQRTISRATRNAMTLCLALVDVDSFKSINDKYGHGAGDEVLREISAIMKQTLREGDIIGRIGGDEFAILLPDTRVQEALPALKRFLNAVAISPFRLENLQIKATVSLGIASLTPVNNNWSRLYKVCDAALYKAKEKGRNQIWLADN